VKERPILFNDEMVRAIQEGRKTQTRRIAKNIERAPNFRAGWKAFRKYSAVSIDTPAPMLGRYCPVGVPGERLWVRETWSDVNLQGAPGIAYRADDDIRDLMEEPSFHDEDGAFNYDDERVKPYHFAVWSEDLLSGSEGRWRPSIHMPRWASRITLEITDIRVERLQAISDKDARAEGVDCVHEAESAGVPVEEVRPRSAFRALWDRINGEDAWDANPWVWVIEFKRIDQEGKGDEH